MGNRFKDKTKVTTLGDTDGFPLQQTSDKHIEASDLAIQLKDKAPHLANQITVGASGDYATIALAVAWFNASATANTEILLDAGTHLIASAITVLNTLYYLSIRGAGKQQSLLTVSVGATYPMFIVSTSCDFIELGATGTRLGGCNFVEYAYDSTAVFSSLRTVNLVSFEYALKDECGIKLTVRDLTINTCDTGVYINHSNASGGSGGTNINDARILATDVGIDLVATGGAGDEFRIVDVAFKNPASGCAIQINDATYTYGTISDIYNCSFNNVGDFLCGFDFTDSYFSDINLLSCIGEADKKAHYSIAIDDNAEATTVTTAGTYYLIQGIKSTTSIVFDLAATGGTFTITIGSITTAAIAWNANEATIDAALVLAGFTAVTVTEVVASKEWKIVFDTDAEGWDETQSVNIASLTTTTEAIVFGNFHSCKFTLSQNKAIYLPNYSSEYSMFISGAFSIDTGGHTMTIAAKKSGESKLLGKTSVWTKTAGEPTHFSLIISGDLDKDDYPRLYVTSSADGDEVTLKDLSTKLITS